MNIKKISLKPSSYDRLESTALKQVIPRLGSFKISEITPGDIGKMMSKIKEEQAWADGKTLSLGFCGI